MSEHDEHSSFIKTPKQLITVVLLAFLVPIIGIVLLVQLVIDRPTADPSAMTPEAVAARPLDEWLELFDDEDVSAGPVRTIAEAAVEFGAPPAGPAPVLGGHTEAWRAELGLGQAERGR